MSKSSKKKKKKLADPPQSISFLIESRPSIGFLYRNPIYRYTQQAEVKKKYFIHRRYLGRL